MGAILFAAFVGVSIIDIVLFIEIGGRIGLGPTIGVIVLTAFAENRTENITVKFVSEQINATRDENGDVVDGNPNAVMDVADFWTFSRESKSKDPNWTLVATNSLE